MKSASLLAVLAFILLPTIAAASCMGGHKDQTAASCAPGMVWDNGSGTCVDKPTS